MTIRLPYKSVLSVPSMFNILKKSDQLQKSGPFLTRPSGYVCKGYFLNHFSSTAKISLLSNGLVR
jgi:hypothetical protein